MKRLFASISAAILAFFLLSCGKEASHRFSLPRESRSGVLLTGLDSLIDANPDSALKMLDAKCKEKDLWDAERYRLELLRAKARNKACVPFRADSLAVMQKVADYYHRKGNANDRMLSLYLLGCAYRDLGSAPRAIETWQQAVAEVDTTRADCDLSTLMRIHSQMNYIFWLQRQYDNSLTEIQAAQRLCWKMKDTLNALIFEEKKCGLLFGEGKYGECIKATERVYRLYLQYGYKDEAAPVCVFAIRSYLALGDYTRAKHYLDIYDSYCLSLTDSRKLIGGLSPYYIYKGDYYLGIGNVDSAEYCYRQAMPEMMKLNNDENVYKGLFKVFYSRGQVDSLRKYMDLYTYANKRNYETSITKATIETKSLYDYGVEQREAREEREKATYRLTLIYLLCGIVVLLLLAVLYTWSRKLSNDLKRQKEIVKHQRVVHDLEIAQEQLRTLQTEIKRIEAAESSSLQHIASLKAERDRLSKEIAKQVSVSGIVEREKKELESELTEEKERIDTLRREQAGFQILIAEKEQEMQRLKSVLKEHEAADNMKDATQRKHRVDNSTVVKHMCEILNNPIRHNLTEQDWLNLRDLIESTYPRFSAQVNKNDLLEDTDYKVCLLVKAGFRPKDLDVFMGWSAGYSSTVRKRLHEVVFNSKGGAHDFDREIGLLQ